MTSIVTWNIQNGKGCDGSFDLSRISRVVRGLGDADVICLQEISRNDPQFDNGADQVSSLATYFSGYEWIWGPTLVRDQRQYGNMILTRLPVLQSLNHVLPHPAEAGIKHMQRAALEVVVQAASGPLRVMTTHLEYYSERHRLAQIARIREIQAEVEANVAHPAKHVTSPYDYVPRPASLVFCGDLNCAPDDAAYKALFQAPFVDAWRKVHPGKPDPHTTGLHDRVQWPMGGHCRDYFAVTPDLAARVASLDMDTATDASDHQPLSLAMRAAGPS
jgi:endonuclease/exonuclease/phosphatase family metal-dependent hydrolase